MLSSGSLASFPPLQLLQQQNCFFGWSDSVEPYLVADSVQSNKKMLPQRHDSQSINIHGATENITMPKVIIHFM
jgi:hypothetical protein